VIIGKFKTSTKILNLQDPSLCKTLLLLANLISQYL